MVETTLTVSQMLPYRLEGSCRLVQRGFSYLLVGKYWDQEEFVIAVFEEIEEAACAVQAYLAARKGERMSLN